MYFKSLSFVTFISAVVAVPTISARSQSCDSGSIHCCNQIGKVSSIRQIFPEFRDELESFSRMGSTSDSFSDLVGLQCTPAAGQGGAGNDWSAVHLIWSQYMLIVFSSSQALCCSNTNIRTVFIFSFQIIIHSLPHRRAFRIWLHAYQFQCLDRLFVYPTRELADLDYAACSVGLACGVLALRAWSRVIISSDWSVNNRLLGAWSSDHRNWGCATELAVNNSTPRIQSFRLDLRCVSFIFVSDPKCSSVCPSC